MMKHFYCTFLAVLSALLTCQVLGFQYNGITTSLLLKNTKRLSRSSSAIRDGYGYFKSNPGEKKDIGRVLKKIIFPGIYTDYAGEYERCYLFIKKSRLV